MYLFWYSEILAFYIKKKKKSVPGVAYNNDLCLTLLFSTGPLKVSGNCKNLPISTSADRHQV